MQYIKTDLATVELNFDTMLEEMKNRYEVEVLKKAHYHADLKYTYPQGMTMFWVDGKLEPAEFDIMYDILDWLGLITDEEPVNEVYNPIYDLGYTMAHGY